MRVLEIERVWKEFCFEFRVCMRILRWCFHVVQFSWRADFSLGV